MMTGWIIILVSVFMIALGGFIFGLYLQRRNRSTQ